MNRPEAGATIGEIRGFKTRRRPLTLRRLKIGLLQLNPTIGAFAANREKLVAAYADAVARGAEFILAPELFLCGYPPRDLLLRDDFVEAKKVKRVLLCSGKLYFDLLDEQRTSDRKDVAIVRMEQLHPFPKKQLDVELAKYPKAKVYWVQEEPENMGYWNFMLRYMRRELEDVISRKPSASPATGYNKIHIKEQKDLVARAFDKPKDAVADADIIATAEVAKKQD